MRLDRLVLKRAPGISAPFTLEPGPGVNLVTGPNGVGKSTLCRAVRALLWPAGDAPYEIEAAFTVDGRPATAARESGRDPEWTGTRPWVGPAHLASRYELGLLDLTVPDPDGDGLAREIRRQMAGGFDLEAVRKDLFGAGSRTGLNEQKAWARAGEEVRRIEREQEGLAARRDRLGDLERRLAGAERARGRVRALGLARSLAEARLARDEAASRLADLPGVMDRVREEDPRDLAAFHRRAAELDGEIRRLETDLAEMDHALAGIPDGEDPDLARRRLQEWREREGDHERAHLAAEEARARAKVAGPPRLGRGFVIAGLAGGAGALGWGLLAPATPPAPWPTALMVLGGILLGGGVLALVVRRRDARLADPGLGTKLARAEAEAREAAAARARDEARARFTGAFGPVADEAEAERRVAEMEARRNRRAGIDRDRAVAAEALKGKRNNLDEARRNAAGILARVAAESAGEVAALVDRLPVWRRATEDLRDAERRTRELEPEVTAARGMLREGEDALPPGGLGERIAEEEARAAEYAGLQREIAGIAKEIELATRGHGLEDALAARAAARADLEAARDTVREAVLGNILLDEVGREYETTARPEVLREADRLFGLFTGHRYELKLAGAAEGRDRFVAQPTEDVKALELDQLSDGTRAQLLLAVRLAFITTAEDESRLPLFLDDALTSADPERFAAVATGLGRIAKEEGRQVFYLTANPADAAAFRRTLAEAGLPAATNLDLAAIRGRAGAADPAAIDPANLPPLASAPDPAGRGVAEYAAALNVPRTDPWADAGGLHVIHLVPEDLDLVRRLVDARAATWGRFAKARKTAVAVGEVTREEADSIAARGAVWEAWLEGWRIGRAAPVARDFLAASKAVSATYLDRVAEALTRAGGDGAALLRFLDAGEVKGFRANKIEQLRDELRDAGLLDERAPLDPDDHELFVLDRVAPHLRDGRLTREKVRALARTFAVTVAEPVF